jgi:hypothetical protein
MPSVSEFQKATSITFAFRDQDMLLKRMDYLLERYKVHEHKADYSKRRVALAELFLTTNYWIKCFHENKKGVAFQQHKFIRAERYPGVLALFESVVNTLAMLLQCGRGQVADLMYEIYGREMADHGYQQDTASAYKAKYLNPIELREYRVYFQGGRLFNRLGKNGAFLTALHPLESADLYQEMRKKNAQGDWDYTSQDFCGFTMTVERELYAGKHDVHALLFHSSYTKGKPVMMAGTMLVERGKLMAIREDSGHYQPTAHNMVAFLQSLNMFAVPLGGVKLYDHTGHIMTTDAEKFLRDGLDWTKFTKAAEKERQHRVNQGWRRDNLEFSRNPPPPVVPQTVVAPPAAPSNPSSYYQTQ